MKRDEARNGSTPPDFLTVEEAARILRIGRTAAYRLARLYLATGGAHNLLPVVRCGKQLRVPRCKLEEMLGGPITWPPLPYERAGGTAVTPITALLADAHRVQTATASER
jgi:Helix-turn-helix domain